MTPLDALEIAATVLIALWCGQTIVHITRTAIREDTATKLQQEAEHGATKRHVRDAHGQGHQEVKPPTPKERRTP